NCLSPPQLRDGKVVAQKLLSCAYRTGQRFVAMHVIDVLVGRMTEKVTQFGHDKLSVFGIGADLNEKQWRAVIRQLVAMGHLRADSEAFGAPRPSPPTPACRPRCGHGAPTSPASAVCRPMSCCTIPPSTASPPRGRRR